MFVRRGQYETGFNEILLTNKMDSAYHTDYHNRSIFYSTLFYRNHTKEYIFKPYSFHCGNYLLDTAAPFLHIYII